MLTEGLLARRQVRSRAERSLAGATTSRRQDGRRGLPTGATASRQRGERWYSLACVKMVLTAGRMTVLRHCRPSLAHWHDDELVMGPMAVLARWRDDVSAAGCKAVLAHSWRLLEMDRWLSISSGPIAVSSTEDLFVALFSCALERAARSPRARRRWEPPDRSEPALDHPDGRTSRLLTSGGRAD